MAVLRKTFPTNFGGPIGAHAAIAGSPRPRGWIPQVRIVTGPPMGSTQPRLAGALMVNLLGTAAMASPEDVEDRLERLRQLPGVHLHWYGKRGQRPGRKLGHVTIQLQAGSEEERRNECRRWLEQVRAIWPRFDSPAAARAA